ncbi:hypothetical protein AB4140_18710 [Shewanella sp. 10N.286.51.B2]|uniref:hypothetical protein n=1 Tax=Shewanella sp. 10N.286.51.B2 TaxID=3229707 RepID=UPI0035514FD1
MPETKKAVDNQRLFSYLIWRRDRDLNARLPIIYKMMCSAVPAVENLAQPATLEAMDAVKKFQLKFYVVDSIQY